MSGEHSGLNALKSTGGRRGEEPLLRSSEGTGVLCVPRSTPTMLGHLALCVAPSTPTVVTTKNTVLRLAGCFAHFYPEDGGCMSLRNANYTVIYLRSSSSHKLICCRHRAVQGLLEQLVVVQRSLPSCNPKAQTLWHFAGVKVTTVLMLLLRAAKKQTPWPLVRKRTIPTERPPPVGEF
jgi:hypothetical protein